jgi:hypothetical protein
MKAFSKAARLTLLVVAASLTVAVGSASANWTSPVGSASNLSGVNTTFTINGSPLVWTCPTTDVQYVGINNSSSLSTAAANVQFGIPNPSNCTTNNAAIKFSSIVSSGTPWTFTVASNLGGGSFLVVITTSQVVLTLTVGGATCVLTIPSGTDIGGTWTNAARSIVIDTDFMVNVAGPVAACGPSGSVPATFTGTFTDQTTTISAV